MRLRLEVLTKRTKRRSREREDGGLGAADGIRQRWQPMAAHGREGDGQ